MKIYAFADEASAMLDNQISALIKNSLDGLEIRNVDRVNVSEISDFKAREVKSKMDAAGLKIWSVGSPIGKIDIETGDFDLHIEKFRRTLEIASILDCKNIRLFSFFIPKDKPAEDYKNEVIERLGKLCEIARGSGITLCHENEKGIYGDIPERCLEIHRALPEIRGIFDPANFVQCGVNTKTAWEMLGVYIKYLHIKDALADGNVVPAGMGVGNLPYILRQFTEKGGNAVTIEPHLTVFEGLSRLENEGDKSVVGEVFTYPSASAAFDAGVNAFKALL